MMKKLLLLLVTAFTLSWAFSQSLELYFEGEALTPNAEITLTAHPDSGLMVLDTLDVKNISDATIEVKCIRTIIDTVPDVINSFCWGLCYPPFTDTSDVAVTIQSQAFSYEFVGDNDPDGNVGIMKVKYTFYSIKDMDDQVSVFVNYEATEPDWTEEYFEQAKMSHAYPNPANNIVSVDYHLKGIPEARIAFYNLLGSKVKEIELTDSFGTLTINTSDFIEGIYFYTLLINNEASQTQKLIIKH